MVRGFSMDYHDLCLGNVKQLHSIRNDAHKKAKRIKSIGLAVVPACLLAVNAISLHMNSRPDINHAIATGLRDTLNVTLLGVAVGLYGSQRQQRKKAADFDKAVMMVHGNDTHILYERTRNELVEQGLFTKIDTDNVVVYTPTYQVK